MVNEKDKEKRFDEFYMLHGICPYCNHSNIINVEHGGFLNFKFDTYKCSRCSREFKSSGSLVVLPKEEVRRIVQAGLDSKINAKELVIAFERIGLILRRKK